MEQKKIKENEKLYETVERIAEKYAKLVDERIDNVHDGLTGTDLRDVYDGIQMLGHVITTLKKIQPYEDFHLTRSEQ